MNKPEVYAVIVEYLGSTEGAGLWGIYTTEEAAVRAAEEAGKYAKTDKAMWLRRMYLPDGQMSDMIISIQAAGLDEE